MMQANKSEGEGGKLQGLAILNRSPQGQCLCHLGRPTIAMYIQVGGLLGIHARKALSRNALVRYRYRGVSN
jgi:hypothetical protein